MRSRSRFVWLGGLYGIERMGGAWSASSTCLRRGTAKTESEIQGRIALITWK